MGQGTAQSQGPADQQNIALGESQAGLGCAALQDSRCARGKTAEWPWLHTMLSCPSIQRRRASRTDW